MADRRYGPPEWPPTSTNAPHSGRSAHIPRQTGYGPGGYPPADARTSAPYGTAPRSAPPYTEEFTYAPPVAPVAPAYTAETAYAPPRHGSTDTAAARSRHTARHGTGEFRTVDDRRPPAGEPPATRTRRADRNRWHWLLLVPIVLPLMPGLYNRIEPTLLGIPFFYWSQLGFAFLASGVIAFVHMKVRPSA